MRIAAKSASASVTRTLEAIILKSGHTIAKEAASADCVIEDTLHPTLLSTSTPSTISLVASSTPQDHAITCPLRPERLIQRLAMLDSTQSVVLSDGWTLDILARTLHFTDGTACTLTEKECSLLKHLTQSHPVPMGRDTLLEQVWGVHGDIDTHTLETHIYRLRAKLNELTPRPCDIITHGGAYALVFGANPG